MIAHLARCRLIVFGDRYACNCGADAQNDLARRLDALRPIAPAPPPDTPLRAVARMLRRLAARATHHDAARHLLATTYAAVELAATLSPAEAIRVLDGVEPTANEPTHSEKPDTPKSP